MISDGLNRFTSLPVLFDMLWHKRLVLLDPSKWEDRNDAYFLARFKAKMHSKSVLAVCFSMARETSHHWKVFASGIAGVCVEFDRNQLLSKVRSDNKLRHGVVRYSSIADLVKSPPDIHDMPFTKRLPFADEKEYRIIYVNSDKKLETYSIAITPKMIRSITLSPNMPKSVAQTIIKLIHSQRDFRFTDVSYSTLLENEKWKSVADHV